MLERAATREDLTAVVDLWRRFETATSGAPESDAAEVRRDWDAPGFSLATGTRVLEDDGAVVGYAVVDDEGGCDSVVDPARSGEGLEERLLEWLEPVGGRTHYWGADDAAAVARFTARGWRPARTYWRMRRELDAPTPEPVWPDGVHVRDLDPGRDGPEAHEVVQTAFADVGDGHVRREYDAWSAAMLVPPLFDAGLSPVAEQDGRLVGVSLAQPQEGFAFLRQLAVPRAQRGRGLALALLHETFRRAAARGLPAVVLGVDAENATGGTRLYERAGMHVVEAFTRWER